MYLPRRMPSMSETATLTRVPGALRTASITLAGVNATGIVSLPCFGMPARGVDSSRCSALHGRAPLRARWHHGAMARLSGTRPRPPHLTAGGSLVALHLGVALFGFAGVFGKWIAWDPVAIVLGRTTVAAIVLALFVRYRLGAWRPPPWIAVPNGVILAVHWVAFFTAIEVSTVAIGLLGYASFPLFVPFLERSMLGLPVTRGKLTGAGLVALGLVLLVPEFTW